MFSPKNIKNVNACKRIYSLPMNLHIKMGVIVVVFV